MLNEERVKQMTKMALLEKNEYHDLRLAEGYRQKDYKSASRLGALVLGTFLYAIVFFGAVGIWLYQYVTVLDLDKVMMVLFVGLVIYVVIMFLCMTRITRTAKKKYAVAHKKLEAWFEEEKKLLDLYEKEEERKNRSRVENREREEIL